MKHINVLLFDDFTVLDAIGPAEVLARLKDDYRLDYFSLAGGEVTGSANVKINTKPISAIMQHDILLVPGGFGTRTLVNDSLFIQALRELVQKSETVLTVCTGSALLAKTGLLNNARATSNKIAWDWVTEQNTQVYWIKKARWVADGKFYTSGGVSAGIDMALGFVADRFSQDTARKIAHALEYVWNSDQDEDLFG